MVTIIPTTKETSVTPSRAYGQGGFGNGTVIVAVFIAVYFGRTI